MARAISHSFAALTREILFLPLEHKIHIFSPPCNILYLLYRHGCFTEKYTTRKIHKNYIRDPSGLFSIISLVSLSMISMISSLSLKLYLNSLVYHRNIFGLPRRPLAIFGNLRIFLEIFGKCSGAFVRPSEQFWKIFENLRKVVALHGGLKI